MDAINLKADLSEELEIVRALIAKRGTSAVTREEMEEAAKEQGR